MKSVQRPSFVRTLPWVLIVAGTIGLICSLVLVHDQIEIWRNPSYQPSCSLNPVISCGSVINSNQGHLFGVPAPFFGLMSFPASITVGLVLLAGAQSKRWFWVVMELGAVGGFLFAAWLFLLSVYRVHALCPFCLVTDATVFTIGWYVTLYNLEQNVIPLSQQAKKVGHFIRRHHIDLLVTWFLLTAIFIVHHFWYYYGRFF